MPVTGFLAQVDADSVSCVSEADRRFLSAFERCELPAEQWTHLAHIRIAWVCLNLDSSMAALARIRQGILCYNTEVLDRRQKYHETVTVAFTHIIADRMRDGENWRDFAERCNELMETGNPILLSYYSENRLFSERARSAFVEPDLRNIPPLVDR